MLKKYEVKRMDIVSRKSFPLEELFRLTVENDVLILDGKTKHPGKGIYIRKEKETLDRLEKHNVLFRYSKSTDFPSLFQEMRNALGSH